MALGADRDNHPETRLTARTEAGDCRRSRGLGLGLCSYTRDWQIVNGRERN